MRLLERRSDWKIVLIDVPPDKIPPYAILSHTWGDDEVTFRDMPDGVDNKLGYEKLWFCANQVARDGLRYFWVDTCCIDKSSSAELQEAINSMFRWYANAVKCYVYLSDVSSASLESVDGSNRLPFESAFRRSRWFTRGWTLQELLAPATVEFFSKNGGRLGDKKSLERLICEITGIPKTALRGTPLYQYTANERFLWARKRNTSREEDWAYSLLGIFDVFMPLIYGEGKDRAVSRLRKEF
ncbi:heterokaryon incompatibility protein-domain-containing protein, partial [Echria macrotheca]